MPVDRDLAGLRELSGIVFGLLRWGGRRAQQARRTGIAFSGWLKAWRGLQETLCPNTVGRKWEQGSRVSAVSVWPRPDL